MNPELDLNWGLTTKNLLIGFIKILVSLWTFVALRVLTNVQLFNVYLKQIKFFNEITYAEKYVTCCYMG